MLKLAPKCGELLRIFPFKNEGTYDVSCGEASGTRFQGKALRLDAPLLPPPPIPPALLGWGEGAGQAAAQAVYQDETVSLLSLFYCLPHCWWPFVYGPQQTASSMAGYSSSLGY